MSAAYAVRPAVPENAPVGGMRTVARREAAQQTHGTHAQAVGARGRAGDGDEGDGVQKALRHLQDERQ
eukprot:18323-Rhodomonas_salina.2